MHWFKHQTASHDNPDISDAMDEFGDAGYSVFFILLEIYGKEFSRLSEGKLTVSLKFLSRKLRKSSGKVKQILNFYSKRQKIVYEIEDKYVTLEIPKFLEITSNWTKRQSNQETPLPTEAPTEAPTAREEEEEEEEEEERDKGTNGGEEKPPPLSRCPHEKIIKLYHEICPQLPRVNNWSDPFRGYLRARWKEYPDLDLWALFFWLDVSSSDFLMGNAKDFQANLGWLVRRSNFCKITNGQYRNRKPRPQSRKAQRNDGKDDHNVFLLNDGAAIYKTQGIDALKSFAAKRGLSDNDIKSITG
ncbi:MAG: DUF4373 domain-containing protein [bacterium]|nr:DUF4373 domain-containing protein [bacterium]